uniref:BH3-interacting domain death agonist isoform X1 n=1 Tax=Jaculus jaculus TaxID=51337 RepID=UPI001E1B05D5|nr:BH3-interacting domain death agonist isoform X1 [Jaculus jaculus]XP_044993542.1 BH3-interacting domain death agonist isoform X1 [Jaculus jaculus]
MDSQVRCGINGTGLRAENVTNLLVLGFLQIHSDSNFQQELEKLCLELPGQGHWQADGDDELQTDGSRISRCFYFEGRIEPDSERQEELIQNIARCLAHVGDEMECHIQPRLVSRLVEQFQNRSLSEEDRRDCLAKALEEVMQTFPRDMEIEKTKLIITMLLAKRVAGHTPSLLRDTFHTTVNFINQNLFAYVRNLVRNEMD